MNRLILADDQVIFRAGAARVLSQEEDMRIVAQCEDAARLTSVIASFRASIVIFSSGLALDLPILLASIQEAGSRAILIADKDHHLPEAVYAQLGGIISRSVTGPQLIEAVRRVAKGQRSIERSAVSTMPSHDAVGARVRDRLTPKELQIVALIVQGCKNKDIATQLNTKEQVIKNYLRSIYDKTGVSDRLELALFTLHHRLLAEAAAKAGTLIQMKSA
ncbi:response regulator transcription factor [Granulicella tundricola]|uniref:Transcriptional regulator, LuxR family n=1 Tax=Granulicella tundricola (strain ATCC BAA-1859 / DSM 23138 / MP5ACTX9) TaxID=1198114 RepID=E8X4C2_GRATM|nr:response regulator transcription factor [Granulicella tundricola]ADW68249.1 transcriptional regulator, LuxR family [Granulicella tundricola MP5ACTX9]